MSDLMIKWREPESGEWRDYDRIDLLGLQSLHDVCCSFSDGFDVVARERDRYIVSTEQLAERYRNRRLWVTTFKALLERGGDHIHREFRRTGFFGLVGVNDVIC